MNVRNGAHGPVPDALNGFPAVKIGGGTADLPAGCQVSGVLPGGLGGVASISACPAALHAVEQVWKQGGFVAAICAAPTVLAALHITDGHPTTCYPGCEEKMGAALPQSGKAVVRDGKLITGTSAGCAVPFALALVAALKGEEKAREIAEQIVIR